MDKIEQWTKNNNFTVRTRAAKTVVARWTYLRSYGVPCVSEVLIAVATRYSCVVDGAVCEHVAARVVGASYHDTVVVC